MEDQKKPAQRVLNLKRSPKDPRDFKFAKISKPAANEPPVVDLRPLDMPIVDQLDIGSCTGNAWAAMHDFLRKKVLAGTGVFKNSSRLFIYNMEREANGDFNEDGGANMRDGGDVLHDIGVVPESSFPYDHKHLYVRPAPHLIQQAAEHRNSTYFATDTVADMRKCLQDGFPFVFGLEVPEAMMGDQMAATGMIPKDQWDVSTSQGGHAVLCVGYDDHKKVWIVRNSWGASWGDHGYFYMDMDYMTKDNSAFDHYTLRL